MDKISFYNINSLRETYGQLQYLQIIPNPQTDEVINTIHFVYETAPQSLPQNRLDIMYKVHVIISGKCRTAPCGKTVSS